MRLAMFYSFAHLSNMWLIKDNWILTSSLILNLFNITYHVASGNLHCTLTRKLEWKRQSLKIIVKIVLTCGPQNELLGILRSHSENCCILY